MYCQLAALTTPTGGKRVVQRENDNTALVPSVLFRTDKSSSVPYFAFEQGGNGTASEGQPQSCNLTSFEYGSIFMSGGRGSRFGDRVLANDLDQRLAPLFGGTYNGALRRLQLTHRGAGPNPFQEPAEKPQDRGTDNRQYEPKLPVRIKTCLP